jgi:hypothetical protein
VPKAKVRLASWLKSSRVTRLLLALFLALAICVIFVGLDNATGIMLGWAATTVLVTELTRRWRRVRSFIILFFASLVGVIILSFLHEEVVYPLAGLIGGTSALQSPALDIYHEVTSLVILFFGPVGMFVGIAGSVILGILRLTGLRNHKHVTGNT